MVNPVVKNILKVVKALSLVLLGIWIGWIIFGGQGHQHTELNPAAADATEWTCSMDPQVRAKEPGKCPLCGMDLIPVIQSSSDLDGVIQMSPLALQLAGVRTEKVSRGEAHKEIRLNGKIQPDERLVYNQSAHLDGRIEQLLVNFTGEYVRKGQVLAYLYAPELVAAQNELFLARQLKDSQPGLFRAAREKLKNWKLTEAQIDTLLVLGEPQDKFPILADVSGQVKAKKVNLGDYVMRGTPIYEIMDLSRVWVLFDAYESDLQWLKRGSKVHFSVQSFPGEDFQGTVSFIDPAINPMTRIVNLRVEMSNPGQKFKPEMFVIGRVQSQLNLDKQALLVPKTAVLWTGERSVVYIKTAQDQGVGFYLQEVTLGPALGDHFVIKSGLAEGDEIAVSGTFSIDAAAQLAGKPSVMKLTDEPEAGPSWLDQVTPQLTTHLEKVTKAYLMIKDALVQGEAEQVLNQVKLLQPLTAGQNLFGLTGEAAREWTTSQKELRVILQTLSNQPKLDAQRLQFKSLSALMVRLVEAFGSKQTLYVQHCPMAMDNAGADWLSNTAEVRNPYFGDLMLTCGKVVKTIGDN